MPQFCDVSGAATTQKNELLPGVKWGGRMPKSP